MDRKALSLPLLITLVIGNVIGTGIFVLPASLAPYGNAASAAWVLTSIGALLLALVYTNLNKRFPRTGGPYVYCYEAFGKMWGFVVGYTYWASTLVSAAAIAIATTGYLGFLFPFLDANSPAYSRYGVLLTELSISWAFVGINLCGIHNAGIVQFILTIIKVIPLIVIPIVGITHFNAAHFAYTTFTHLGSFSSISSAAALTFWAFVGLEAATIPAENTKGPHDIFIATVFGTIIIGILYFFSTFVLMGLIPADKLATLQFPFATAGTILFGTYAAIVMALFAVVSGLGALNSTILLQGQIVFAAARDHMFPRSFAKLSKHDVPVHAQLLAGICISVLLLLTTNPVLLKQFDFVAMLATLLTLFTYFATSLAECKFNLKSGKSISAVLFRPTTIVAVLAGAYALWMIANFTFGVILTAICIACLCIPIYYCTVRRYA